MTSVYEGHIVTTRQHKNISCLTFPFRTLGRVRNIAADTASYYSYKPHAADTQCLVVEREGQIIKLGYNATKWMSVVTRKSKTIQWACSTNLFSKLHLKNATIKKQT